MPKPHVGLLSGVTYEIPAYIDDADIEKGFGDFADTIPKAPAVMRTTTETSDVAVMGVNTLYVFDSPPPSAGSTLTLAAGVDDGDKVQVLQLQDGPVTIDLNGISYQGPTATSGHFTALTLIWQAAEQRWVGSPFSFSGDLPTESQGGDIFDVNGRRYHVFSTPGPASFYSHQDALVNVLLVGPGGDGSASGAGSGNGGHGGVVTPLTGQHVDTMQSYRIVVGANGQPTVFHKESAAAGADGDPATATTPDAVFPLDADLQAVLGYLEVGGSGQADTGPILPATYGRGGGGAHLLLAEQPRTSHVEVINHPGSAGSPGYHVDESYGAERYQSDFWGETINGDTMACPGGTQACGNGQCCVSGTNCSSCVGAGSCPGGWWVAPGGGHCQTYVQHPIYSYRCPNGGSLNGTTCVKGYDVPGSPGSPAWTEHRTAWDPCPSGYKPGADTTKCVDARDDGHGEGGDGLVVVHYALP
jgi:hypothetical protein